MGPFCTCIGIRGLFVFALFIFYIYIFDNELIHNFTLFKKMKVVHPCLVSEVMPSGIFWLSNCVKLKCLMFTTFFFN